jgi:ubiquinone/menaquinone biosynthesis C-methylase UbiE
MILLRYFQDLRNPAAKVHAAVDTQPRLLNVGGGSKDIPLPKHYGNWRHDLLDIDPKGKPDVVCDARELNTLAASQYDAVYCSHNLEHYYQHDGPRVLKGFLHVLKPDGFAEIRVPDMNTVMKRVAESELDIEDVLYQSPSGPITVRDVFYGYAKQIESSGMDFYAHKTGFTLKSLRALLMRSGFPNVHMFVAEEAFEVRAIAFKKAPTAAQRILLELPASSV